MGEGSAGEGSAEEGEGVGAREVGLGEVGARQEAAGEGQPEAITLYLACGYRDIPGYGHYRQARRARFFGKPLV